MNSSTLALTAAVLCLVMSPARAQQPVAPRPLHSVVVETYAFSGLLNEQPVTVLTPALFANIVLSERVSLNAAWIFAYAPARNGVPGTFLAGNPSIGPSVVLKGGDLRIRAGGSLVLPFTLLTDADDQQAALLKRAATLRGNSGVSLMAPGLLGLT
ncbi:hypothetical protein [Cystobacter ferrugineus]|uniref:Uncharacterized protein n=1 Tax=Cystobacter ferrugineus TaxID=83449 RepID=A0A1L9B4J8_9BACT|nr:hypothetical protein [Cystobacter ferrugineus]OJH37182.1 hypothetical protein BON30_28080 [Cystobacter ferrugineus]